MKNSNKIILQLKTHRITCSPDRRNWILEELREGGIFKKTGQQGASKWVEIGYYGKLEHLVSRMFDLMVEVPKGSDLAKQLDQIVAEIKKAESNLIQQIEDVCNAK